MAEKERVVVSPLPHAPREYDERDQTELRSIVERVLRELGTRAVLNESLFTLPNFSDSDRPDAGSVEPGTPIWNTDDGQMNISDGTNWTLPDGTTT